MTADACRVTLNMLASRTPGGTICPSEVARAMAPGDDWREVMPAVHFAVDCLLEERLVALSWKGQQLTSRAGPYRISLETSQTN